MHVKRRGIEDEARKFGGIGGGKQTAVLNRILNMAEHSYCGYLCQFLIPYP